MKNLLIFVVIIVLIVLALVYWKPEAATPAGEQPTDTTSSIDSDLSSISAEGGFEADMESLDSDINTL